MGQLLKKISGLLLLVFAAGCTTFMQEPKVVVKRTSLIGLDTAGADMEFYLGITNPNSFDLSLLGYTYDLRVMTLPLVSGGGQESLRFKAGRETDMRLPVRLRFADMIEVLKRQPDPDAIPYQMSARLQVRTFAGEMTVPVENNGSFSVPETYRPRYYLDRLRDLLR